MVGRAVGRQTFQRQEKDKESGQDDHQDEGKVYPERLPDHSVQAHVEPETEVDDGEKVHRGIIQVQH